MTKSTITRERLQEIAEDGFLKHGESKELARMALAAMDSEPVALTANIERDAQRYRFLRERDAFGDDGEPGIASWDDLIELDTNEFDAAIDARMAHPSVDFLALDNALQKHERRRCKDRNCNKPIYGYSVDGLCEDCYTAVSQRPAPECEHQWRHGGANKLQNQKQCIKCGRVELDSQQPVVPDERAAFNAWNNEDNLPIAGVGAKNAAWLAWQARSELAGNSPVIPEGYVMVPMRLTAENGAKGALSGEFSETKFVNCPECFGDDECETCDGSGRIEIKVPVSWTTIKDIWIKGVEHFAAAPQENN